MGQVRRRAQKMGAFALAPFVVLLIVHGVNHDVPLFLASFAGSLAALPGIVAHSADARAGAARSAARVRRVLLPVPAVPVDHAADATAASSSHAAADPAAASRRSAMRTSPSRSSSARRSSRPSSTTTSSPTSPRAACTASTSTCSTSSRWRRSPATRSAAAGRTSAAPSRWSPIAFIQRDVDEHYTPVQWIKEMTPGHRQAPGGDGDHHLRRKRPAQVVLGII